ncbi:MAG: riboflavin synthase [Planctomycetales bacterium]|nr:riboflavin synthase [Planctomycetales bacterium]
MFTGLVESLARIERLEQVGPGVKLTVVEPQVAASLKIGDSVAVNGCCLTVVELKGSEFTFDAGEETLNRTNLGRLQAGDQVNLETSMALGDDLGGHLVTGHIDGLGKVVRRDDDAEWCTMRFEAPAPLMRQMASKGSIAVDGVSLTLVDVEADQFSVALIPHTLQVTTLGFRRPGDEVNLETDVLAKYVERQLSGFVPSLAAAVNREIS